MPWLPLSSAIFRRSAGITNPTESGADRISLRTSKDVDNIDENLTLMALGVEGGQPVTFWLDANGDGIRGSAEADLCSLVATGNDVAVGNFTISSPPFLPGTGTDCDLPGLINCNFINVVGGENRTTTGVLDSSQPLTGFELSRQTFDLTGGSVGAVGTPGIQQTPEDPGAAARYSIKLTTPTILQNGAGRDSR